MRDDLRLKIKSIKIVKKIHNSPIGVRLIKTFGVSVFGQVITAVIQIISVPIFLKYWGVNLYGEWLILSSISTYLTMSDIGFANVAANEMTILVSQGERDKALDVFQSTWLFISGTSFIITCIVCSGVWFCPIEHLLNLKLQSHSDAALILSLLTLNVWVNLQSGLVSAGFRSEGQFARAYLLYNFQRIASFLAISITVILGGTPLECAFAMVVASIFFVSARSIDLKRCYPWIRYGYKYSKMKTIIRLVKPAVAFMSFPMGDALNQQGLITLIGVILGSNSVVIFSTLRTLTRLAWQMINIINISIGPEISMAYGTQNYSLLRKLHRRSCQASFFFAFGMVLFLIFFGQWILFRWTTGSIVFNPIVFYTLLLTIITNSFWNTSSIVALSTNLHQKIASLYIISNILCLAFSFLLMQILGLNGAAASMLVIDLLMLSFVLKLSMQITNDNLKDFSMAVIRF